MPKVKFNVKGVEVRRGGGEPIPKGVYLCTIESCAVTKPQGKDERIEAVYVIKDGDQKGRKLFDYVNLVSEAAAWKVREFLEATGIVSDKKEAGEFDPAKLVGDEINVRVIHQPDNRPEHAGEMQHRVGGIFSPDGEEAEDEDLEPEEPEGDEEGDEEIDLDEMDRPELKKLIKERELGIVVKQSMSDDDIREAIAEALNDDEEPEEPEAEEPEEPEEDEIDLDELDRKELKKLIKDQGLEIKVFQSTSDDDLRAAIAEKLGGDDDAPDYEAMDLDELKNTAKERGLKTTGTKKILVARLKTDDESRDENDPF